MLFFSFIFVLLSLIRSTPVTPGVSSARAIVPDVVSESGRSVAELTKLHENKIAQAGKVTERPKTQIVTGAEHSVAFLRSKFEPEFRTLKGELQSLSNQGKQLLNNPKVRSVGTMTEQRQLKLLQSQAAQIIKNIESRMVKLSQTILNKLKALKDQIASLFKKLMAKLKKQKAVAPDTEPRLTVAQLVKLHEEKIAQAGKVPDRPKTPIVTGAEQSVASLRSKFEKPSS